MPNLRVVYQNVADVISALTASSTAGSLAAANLLNDRKTEVWRSSGTTATLTATWNRAWPIRMVALAFSNLSPTATMVVESYRFAGDASPQYTSPSIPCSQTSVTTEAPVGFGGGVYATAWFEPGDVSEKIVITITDSASSTGYLQAGRLVIGDYWSPDRDAESDSVRLSMADETKQTRSESGVLWTDRGPMFKKLSFDLSYMSSSDRNTVWRMLTGNGEHTSVFVSLLPGSSEGTEEQLHTIYGRLSASSSIQYKYQHLHATQLQIEEV